MMTLNLFMTIKEYINNEDIEELRSLGTLRRSNSNQLKEEYWVQLSSSHVACLVLHEVEIGPL